MLFIQLLNQLDNLGAIFAALSLSAYEHPCTHRDDYGVTDGDGQYKPYPREFLLAGHASPAIEASTDMDGAGLMQWSIPSIARLPREVRIVMALMGGGRASGDTASGSADAEEWSNRNMILDSAASLLMRIRRYTTDKARVEASVIELLAIASKVDKLRRAVEERGGYPEAENPLWKQRDRVAAELSTLLASGTIPGLVGAVIQDDPRGGALGLKFDGCDYSYPNVRPMNWPIIEGLIEPKGTNKAKKVGSGKYAVKPSKVDASVLAVLRGAFIASTEVRITEQLSTKTYGKVNEFLRTIGGQWHTGRQAHVFKSDASLTLGPILLSGEALTSKDFEFFPTPESVVDLLMARVQLKPGYRVLEPHAGRAAIASRAAKIVGTENVTCYELMPDNVEHLAGLGFKVCEPTDFLSVVPDPTYDCVLLNPPFSGGRDIAHITHALKFVRPGGELAAIASPSWAVESKAPQKAFAAMLRKFGAKVEDIPHGAFAESGTGTATKLLHLRVPLAASPFREALTVQAPRVERVAEQAEMF